MKKTLFCWPLALSLTLGLAGCASNIGGAPNSDTANSTSTNSDTSNATTSNATTSNSVTNNAATSQPSETPKSETAKSETAKSAMPNTSAKSGGAAKKTYVVVDEAQPGYPPVIAAEIRKFAVAPPPASMKVPDKARVLFTTSKGDITVELNGKAAPLHVKSFLYLTQKGFYNGTTFHRFADLTEGSGKASRIIQGGDPLSKDANLRQLAGAGGPGYHIPREYNALKHDAMVLAMARTRDPDSAGSQFYFTLDATPFLDRENAQDGFGYTVFGRVVKGQNVVLKLRQDDVLKKVAVVK